MIVREDSSNLYPEERRVSALVTKYTDSRRQEAERGELSLKMYDEDRRQVEMFQSFSSFN